MACTSPMESFVIVSTVETSWMRCSTVRIGGTVLQQQQVLGQQKLYVECCTEQTSSPMECI